MNHLVILPLLMPMVISALLLFFTRRGGMLVPGLNLATCLALVLVAVLLLIDASADRYHVYALGNWPPPFGIVLVLDRLSALMLLLTSLVALVSLVYALAGKLRDDPFFHILFQFLLLGLNGAFLTGDIFNLFVFFEILLIASYGLLLRGEGESPVRTRATLHYVVLNLTGSAFFLLAVGVIYGVTGTLNMADLARVVAEVDPADAALLRAGALLLLVVFALKAALLPLYFWLPAAYGNASAPVAALFTIMTKVGVYSILRVYTIIFGAHAGVAAGVAEAWLLPVALATIVLGAIGALSARRLQLLVAYLLVVSVGTMLAGIALFNSAGISAALYYLPHSTLATACLFLLADAIARQRGTNDLVSGVAVVQPAILGPIFFLAAIGLAGLPPLSGFFGKVLILEAATEHPAIAWVWGLILASSLVGIIALSRAGSVMFWKTQGESTTPPASKLTLAAIVLTLAASPVLVLLLSPVHEYAVATSTQLLSPLSYMDAVLSIPSSGQSEPVAQRTAP